MQKAEWLARLRVRLAITRVQLRLASWQYWFCPASGRAAYVFCLLPCACAFMTEVLAAAAAAFVVGIALGWALARSSRAAVALREDNARLRAELAHLQQAVPATARAARPGAGTAEGVVRLAGGRRAPIVHGGVPQARRSEARERPEGRARRARTPPAGARRADQARSATTLAQVDRKIGESDVARAADARRDRDAR